LRAWPWQNGLLQRHHWHRSFAYELGPGKRVHLRRVNNAYDYTGLAVKELGEGEVINARGFHYNVYLIRLKGFTEFSQPLDGGLKTGGGVFESCGA